MFSLLFLILSSLYYQNADAQGNGAVRLNNNGNVDPSNTEGLVEVYINGQWGNVCSDGYGVYIDDVVCHQLGYSFGYILSNNDNPSNIVLTSVYCSADNLVLLQCTHRASSTCSSFYSNVKVRCSTERIWDYPYSGMIRLQGGTYTGQGQVQVYCSGEWGAICTDNIGSNVGDTICNQLGYNNLDGTSTTTTSGTVWLSNLNCYSSYPCLGSCSGGSCPSIKPNCATDVLSVNCSYVGDGGGGSNQYTCYFNNFPWPVGSIIAAIIGSLILLTVCVLAIVGIPLCICCCLGIGIGAAANRNRRSYDAI